MTVHRRRWQDTSPVGRRTAVAGLVALGASLWCSGAAASATIELGYTRLQVYSGALRFLRIDLGYEITEKDADAAYLLFKYQSHDQEKSSFGAFEIIETKAGVRLAVKLPQMPSYHENVLRDGLVKKLRQDYGESAPKPPEKKKDKERPEQDDDAPTDENPPPKGKLPIEHLPDTPPEQ